jgi:hypothetical protein
VSHRLTLLVAFVLLAFAAAHVVGISKLQASHADQTVAPAMTRHLGD